MFCSSFPVLLLFSHYLFHWLWLCGRVLNRSDNNNHLLSCFQSCGRDYRNGHLQHFTIKCQLKFFRYSFTWLRKLIYFQNLLRRLFESHDWVLNDFRFSCICSFDFSHSKKKKICGFGTFLVVQWLRICLSMQGMQFHPLSENLRSHVLQDN